MSDFQKRTITELRNSKQEVVERRLNSFIERRYRSTIEIVEMQIEIFDRAEKDAAKLLAPSVTVEKISTFIAEKFPEVSSATKKIYLDCAERYIADVWRAREEEQQLFYQAKEYLPQGYRSDRVEPNDSAETAISEELNKQDVVLGVALFRRRTGHAPVGNVFFKRNGGCLEFLIEKKEDFIMWESSSTEEEIPGGHYTPIDLFNWEIVHNLIVVDGSQSESDGILLHERQHYLNGQIYGNSHFLNKLFSTTSSFSAIERRSDKKENLKFRGMKDEIVARIAGGQGIVDFTEYSILERKFSQAEKEFFDKLQKSMNKKLGILSTFFKNSKQRQILAAFFLDVPLDRFIEYAEALINYFENFFLKIKQLNKIIDNFKKELPQEDSEEVMKALFVDTLPEPFRTARHKMYELKTEKQTLIETARLHLKGIAVETAKLSQSSIAVGWTQQQENKIEEKKLALLAYRTQIGQETANIKEKIKIEEKKLYRDGIKIPFIFLDHYAYKQTLDAADEASLLQPVAALQEMVLNIEQGVINADAAGYLEYEEMTKSQIIKATLEACAARNGLQDIRAEPLLNGLFITENGGSFPFSLVFKIPSRNKFFALRIVFKVSKNIIQKS